MNQTVCCSTATLFGLLATVLLPLAAGAEHGPMQATPERSRLVDPFIGTSGTDNANGHTFPGASLPFGMLQWSPDTISGFTPGHAGSYLYYDKVIRGFSLNHLSGPGCFVFGDVPIMPVPGRVEKSPAADSDEYTAQFSHNDERAYAGFYSVALKSGIKTELTATLRTGQARFTFPHGSTSSLLINVGRESSKVWSAKVQLIGDRKIAGEVTGGDFCGRGNRYTVYFAAEFDRPFRVYGTWESASLRSGSRVSEGANSGAFVTFDTQQNTVVQMKTAISYVSVENAWLNLRAENSGSSFEQVERAARQAWDKELSLIRVVGASEGEQRIFYTALYHALLQPNVFEDVNGDYVGFDRKKHRVSGRDQYANFSGWDMYRSQIQLLAMLHPKETSAMIESLLTDAQQGGALPLWPLANDDTCSMVGDPDDLLITEARAFGAAHFDQEAALKTMLRDATTPGVRSKNCLVRPALEDYLRLGYLGPDSGSGPSQTLEFTAADFAISQFAEAMGDGGDAEAFRRRAGFWKNIFNTKTGFIEPRHNDGSWFIPLNPGVEIYSGQGSSANRYRWVEGNAAQYSWMIPYNMRGLFDAMGDRRKVAARLDNFFTKLNAGSNEPYFWMGNEPVFAAPWAYDFAGEPWRTQAVVRRIESELFTDQPDGLPGNDDLGATSAWYVFAATGIYPAVPGIAGFCLNSPLFTSMVWRLGNGKALNVTGKMASLRNPYVEAVTLNGVAYQSSWIPYSKLAGGATLLFELSARPNEIWASGSSAIPPSFE